MTTIDPDDVPPTPIELGQPAATSRRRSPRRLAAAGVVGVLAIGAGVFGITAMNEPDGAGSPAAAVEAFFDAVDDQDVLGLLEAVDPVERGALRRAVEGIMGEADRAAVTDGVDLRDVSGVDLRVEDLAHETTTFASGLAGVDLTGGTVTSDVDLADLPIGRTVRDVLDPDEAGPERGSLDLAGLRLMTVEREGRWYVSPTYTGAEALRRSLDPEPAMPTFAEPLDAIGGDSPEGVVQDLAAAIDDLDLTAMFGLTSPSRARVLHDYAPMLIEAAGELDPDEVALADVELTTAGGPDGTTLVTVTGYELRFTQDDGSTSYRLADGCLTTSWDYADAYADEFSGDESWFPEEVSSCEPFDPSNRGYPGFFARGGLFGFGLEAPVFTVVEEDGRWYLDPLDSLGTSIVSMLRDLSTDELQWTVRWWSGAVWLIQPDELWAACGIDRPADGVDRETGEAALDRCIEQLPAEYTGGWYPSPYGGADIADPAIDDEWTDPTEGCRGAAPAAVDSCLRRLVDDGLIAPVDACWAQPDQAATYSCFERGVADGTIDALDGCYVLDDLDATGSCLRDGVAAGTVDEAEAGRFECERSVDWRAPDDEAMAAYDACVAGVDGSP